MDIVSEAQRSYNMSRIRGSNTKPEVWVRSCLHRLGFRFTVNSRQNKSLPGKPDIILPKYKICLFVHGCFWHAHEGCPFFRVPATRREWWEDKLLGNAARDRKNEEMLREMGWRVGVVWECALRNSDEREKLKERLQHLVVDRSDGFQIGWNNRDH